MEKIDKKTMDIPAQLGKVESRVPLGHPAGSASDRTHTVGKPDHRCWSADRQ